MTRNDNLTSQIDGVRDTFSTANPYRPGTLALGYNGQIFPAGVNISAEVTSTTFKLSFVPPTNTSFLSVLYEDLSGDTAGIVASSMPPR